MLKLLSFLPADVELVIVVQAVLRNTCFDLPLKKDWRITVNVYFRQEFQTLHTSA